MVTSFTDNSTFSGIDRMANQGRVITTVQAEGAITNGQIGSGEAFTLVKIIDPGFYDKSLGEIAWILVPRKMPQRMASSRSRTFFS